MLERDIPDRNLFMMCENPNPAAFTDAPAGYHIRPIRPEEMDFWYSVHFDSEPGDISPHIAYMKDYFHRVYEPRGDEFFRRCLVICGEDDVPLGTCFAWKVYDDVWTIHWYKVSKCQESKGLGRALLSAVLNTVPDDGYPVYLHTQPSSFRAIHLYTAFGFSLLCDPAVGHRENHLTECLPYLEYFMGEKYDRLTYAASDGTLHRAALTVEDNRF